jgi:hypothetical protein
MISNEISLSYDEKITSFTKANLSSIRKIFYKHIKSEVDPKNETVA